MIAHVVVIVAVVEIVDRVAVTAVVVVTSVSYSFVLLYYVAVFSVPIITAEVPHCGNLGSSRARDLYATAVAAGCR